jgi:hypothetical protein
LGIAGITAMVHWINGGKIMLCHARHRVCA